MHGVTDMVSQLSAGDQPKRRRRRKNKPLPRGPFDRRTRIAKRREVLVKTFTAQIIDITPALAVKVAAAAELVALSEQYRGSFIRGESKVPLDDLIRLERLASSSVRSLGLQHRAQISAPTLSDYLRRQGEDERGGGA